MVILLTLGNTLKYLGLKGALCILFKVLLKRIYICVHVCPCVCVCVCEREREIDTHTENDKGKQGKC